MEQINVIKRKESRERGIFSDRNDAHNDEAEDEPSLAPAPERMLDGINNNKYNVTLGRCLEVSINFPRREVLNTLKFDGMSRREIRLRCVSLARKCHPDKWVERTLVKHKVKKIKNVANAYAVLRS